MQVEWAKIAILDHIWLWQCHQQFRPWGKVYYSRR